MFVFKYKCVSLFFKDKHVKYCLKFDIYFTYLSLKNNLIHLYLKTFLFALSDRFKNVQKRM